MAITLIEVRRRILIAMVSDDELMNTLVLKGGNALALVHDIGHRASLDMDFSIASHFPDLAEAKDRIFTSLRREFKSIGYAVFDDVFVPKPSVPGVGQPEWWGGYFVEFKLAELGVYEQYKDDLENLRRRAAVLGPQQRRKYTIDISKNEYCATKVRREFDDLTMYVYSPEMIAIEKLRAICQQMPEYPMTTYKTPRARDFYDIYEIVHEASVDLMSVENQELFAHIFDAKQVPLKLLGEISRFRDFHEPDWPAVVSSISGEHQPFEYYFNFVVELTSRLQSLWVI
jgi:predicted nucleotidyltransferase component of viral defense system